MTRNDVKKTGHRLSINVYREAMQSISLSNLRPLSEFTALKTKPTSSFTSENVRTYLKLLYGQLYKSLNAIYKDW